MLAKSGPQAEATFLRSLAAGELTVEPLGPADYARMADLVVRYGKFPLGAADASVIAVAERLEITTVATLDYRHSGRSPRDTVSRSTSSRASTNWPATTDDPAETSAQSADPSRSRTKPELRRRHCADRARWLAA